MKKEQLKEAVILDSTLEEIMGDRFGKYSKYIIQDRALPDARDGLKPVQRRILYAMHKDGNTFDKPHRKSAKTVGLVIGNYHPHGDTSVYDAMVRLSQPWKINHPLVDMHGNNGSIDDDPAAAMRYTEARLSKIAGVLIADIDQQTVDFAPNFDDTDQEPVVLPAGYPNLLVNGATGIAAGYATNIPPHNLNEVIDAIIFRIDQPDCSLEQLCEIVKGPDFPTGGIVQGHQGIKDAFASGKGRVIVRSKAEIVETKSVQQIVITEIPYEVIKANLVRKMDEIRLAKTLDGIIDVRDESDRNGLRIAVDVKKEADAQLILNYLYKNTDLQISYNYNMVAIVDKRPEQMGLAQLIDAYIVHREEVILKRSKYQFNKLSERVHILEGLIKAVSVVDEVIAIIRKSKDKADAKVNLCARFGFTDMQAEAIVNLRLYRLTSTDIVELKREAAELAAKLSELKAIIENELLLRRQVVRELREIQKEFGIPRRTQIESDVQEIVIDKTAMITNETVRITLSADAYVKRVSLRSYSASGNDMPGLKDGDRLIGHIGAEMLNTLLIFASDGSFVCLPVYQLEEAKWKDLGSHLGNYVKLNGSFKAIAGVLVTNFEADAQIVSLSAKGQIKRTRLADYQLTRTSKPSINMNLKGDDRLVCVQVMYPGEDVHILTRDGYVARFSLEEISLTANRTQGVRGISLSRGDEAVWLGRLINNQALYLVMSSTGQMKRIHIEEIGEVRRATRGQLILKRKKTKPDKMLHFTSVNTLGHLALYSEGLLDITGKDIPIMSVESTLSTPYSLKSDWYWIYGIQEAYAILTMKPLGSGGSSTAISEPEAETPKNSQTESMDELEPPFSLEGNDVFLVDKSELSEEPDAFETPVIDDTETVDLDEAEAEDFAAIKTPQAPVLDSGFREIGLRRRPPEPETQMPEEVDDIELFEALQDEEDEDERLLKLDL